MLIYGELLCESKVFVWVIWHQLADHGVVCGGDVFAFVSVQTKRV